MTTEEKALNLLVDLIINDKEPNLVNVISKLNGWSDLQPLESMTIHYGDKEYRITRRDLST